MSITQELKELLYKQGAVLVGIGDMSPVPDCQFPIGISVAVPIPKSVVIDLKTAPTREYYELYGSLNRKLNEIVETGECFLKEKGYAAWAQTTDRVYVGEDYRSAIPHKTVATRAGLGWIGKNCLLVTPEYGPAIRISSLFTDAPLVCDDPVEVSDCGGCSLCVRNCPAGALKGTIWTAGMERERIVDVETCYQKQREIMSESTGIDTDLCGKCFAVCAYTQKYLDRTGGNESVL